MLTQKIFAFVGLLSIQLLVSVVYKYSQTKGDYAYSPLAIIACAEAIKLCMSSFLFLFYSSTTVFSLIKEQVTKVFLFNTFGLAVLYCLNNQLAFVLFLHVDPASISLFKSLSSLEAAILLWAIFERHINQIQWGSICLQVIGLIIVQYDACKSSSLFSTKFYFLLIASSLITAVCTVVNEHLIKTYNVNLNIQNGILYCFGFMLNLSVFLLFPNIYGHGHKGFFEGYSWIVVAVIGCNSILGIAITFVYKYADAIVKTFSTACASGFLLFLNVTLFHVHTNLVSFLGASVIFIASYIYFLGSSKSISSLPPSIADSANVTEQNSMEDNATIASQKHTANLKLAAYVISILIGILFFVYTFTSVTANYSPKFLVNNQSESTQTNYFQPQYPSISHIEDLKINHRITIYGWRLCTNETRNDTRLFINGFQCVPIEICSDKLVLCRLQNHRNGSSLSSPINIRLMTKVYDKKSSKHFFFNASFFVQSSTSQNLSLNFL
jgi:drug/metabolite transporter (DMT)-like permease